MPRSSVTAKTQSWHGSTTLARRTHAEGASPRPLPLHNCRFPGTPSALNQFRRSITNRLRRRKRDLVEMENSLRQRMLVVSQILDQKLPLAALAVVYLRHGSAPGRGIFDAAPRHPANDFRLRRYPNTTAARQIGSESSRLACGKLRSGHSCARPRRTRRPRAASRLAPRSPARMLAISIHPPGSRRINDGLVNRALTSARAPGSVGQPVLPPAAGTLSWTGSLRWR